MNIVYILLGILLLAVVTIVVLYYGAPAKLLKAMYGLMRLRAGLKRKEVEVEGYVWPYLEGGPADGIPLVLMHGFGGDKDNWTQYAPYMVGKYRLISPDLPGFAENDRSLDREYDIPTQAKRLVAFLDALGIEKCHLGGNSMGGFLALQMALDFPERLLTMTSFNGAGVASPKKSELLENALKGENGLVVDSFEELKPMLEMMTYKPMPMPSGFLRPFFDEMQEHKELLDKIFWSLGTKGGEMSGLNDRLHEIKLPCFVVWGRHDRLLDVSAVEVLEQGIENCESIIFEDVGHVPMIEKPKETAEHHLRFLAKH